MLRSWIVSLSIAVSGTGDHNAMHNDDVTHRKLKPWRLSQRMVRVGRFITMIQDEPCLSMSIVWTFFTC